MDFYTQVNDFYNRYRYDLTSDEVSQIEAFLDDFEPLDEDETFDGIVTDANIKPFDTSVSVDFDKIISDDVIKTTLTPAKKIKSKSHDLSIDDIVSDLTFNIPMVQKQRLKPLDSKAQVEMPIVRKRRKQWAGQPTFRTVEFDPKKAFSYMFRSFKRKLPEIGQIDSKTLEQRMRRSVSHVYIKADLNVIETKTRELDANLHEAFMSLGYLLFEREQENTSARKDAWDFYMNPDALDDFLNDAYAPTTVAFVELHAKMKEFIKDEWYKYRESGLSERAKAYGYHLSQSDVSKLESSDKSFLTNTLN